MFSITANCHTMIYLLYFCNNMQVLDKPRSEFCVERLNWVSGHMPSYLSQSGGAKVCLFFVFLILSR